MSAGMSGDDVRLGVAALVAVRLVVALGVLVVVPLGLRLIGEVPRRLVRWWPVAGAAGAAAMWLPRGVPATALAAAYGAATGLLALVGVRRSCRFVLAWTASGGALEVAVLTALLGPAVAASALVAERAGVRLFGFELDILTLTVPHLHFAGFAAALVAGLVARAAGRGASPSPWAAAAALTVPAGTTLVLLGYFVGDAAELAGAVVLTAGMWLVAWLTWTRVRASAAVAGASRARVVGPLLGLSSSVLVVTMLLALSWALGEATGLPHPSLGWMVATHGVANALGFALCGVLAWRAISEEAL